MEILAVDTVLLLGGRQGCALCRDCSCDEATRKTETHELQCSGLTKEASVVLEDAVGFLIICLKCFALRIAPAEGG